MRQLSQRDHSEQMRAIEVDVRIATNRILETECGVSDYATPQVWQGVVRSFKSDPSARNRPIHDLFRYRRELEIFAKERLYFGALLANSRQPPKRRRGTCDRPFLREKSRRRNLEIAWFVVERTVAFLTLLKGEDLLFGHHGRQGTAPWAYLAEEWNRTHPHDHFTAGKVKTAGDNLKDEYYRARRRLESDIFAHFNEVLWEVVSSFGKDNRTAEDRIFAPAAERLDLYLAQQPLLQKPVEKWTPALAEQWRRWQSEEVQRYRDGLTLPELIDYHIWKVRSAWTSTARETGRCHEAPLRPWFLVDVLRSRGESVRGRVFQSQDPLTEVLHFRGPAIEIKAKAVAGAESK